MAVNFLNKHSLPTVLRYKLGWVKLSQIAPDSPKFFPTTVLHYTVLDSGSVLMAYNVLLFTFIFIIFLEALLDWMMLLREYGGLIQTVLYPVKLYKWIYN